MLRKISWVGVLVLSSCGMTLPAQAQSWTDYDLTANVAESVPSNGPLALAYDPHGGVVRSHYVSAIDGHVHDHYLDPTNGWIDYDLTANVTGAVPAAGQMALLYDPRYRTFRNHYVGNDGHVHELYLDYTSLPLTWRDYDLTLYVGGPTPAGPIAMAFDPNGGIVRCHYIGNDMHMHEHYLDTTWHEYDLTANVAGAVPTNGSLALVFDPTFATFRDHYVGTDGDVHELYLPGGGTWTDYDLTLNVGGVPATGPIAMVFDPREAIIRSQYIGNDMQVHEHWLDTTPAWHQADLTVDAGAASIAVGPLALVYDPVFNVIRNHYIGSDMHMHELYLLAFDGPWIDYDLTANVAGTVPAAGPHALIADPDGVIRSHYIGNDAHVHELYLQY
jgi:hypothetical protein